MGRETMTCSFWIPWRQNRGQQKGKIWGYMSLCIYIYIHRIVWVYMSLDEFIWVYMSSSILVFTGPNTHRRLFLDIIWSQKTMYHVHHFDHYIMLRPYVPYSEFLWILLPFQLEVLFLMMETVIIMIQPFLENVSVHVL